MEDVLMLNEGAAFAAGTIVVQEDRKELNKFQEFYKEKFLDSGLSERLDEDIIGLFSIGGGYKNIQFSYLSALGGQPILMLIGMGAGKLMSKACKTAGNIVVSGKHFVEGKIFGLEEFLPKKPVVPTETPVRGPMVIPEYPVGDSSEPVVEKQKGVIFDREVFENAPLKEMLGETSEQVVSENSVVGGKIR